MQIKKDGDAMRRKMTYLIYIFLIAILFSNIIIPNYSFAQADGECGSALDSGTGSTSSSGTSSGGGSSSLNINTSNYKPGTPTLGTTTSQKVGIILSALQAVGAIGIVVAIALIGFDMILGSASEKAISKEKMIGILVAAIMITGGTTIAKVIVNIANSF